MATLSGNKIKDTYQSLVKFSDNGNITTSAKQLTDGFGNNSPMFVSTTQVGIGVTPESGLNLHVFGDAKIGSNLTVIGNLVVEGSTTTVGTDTLTVKDPLIVLANNNTSTDAVDIGFYGKYTPSGTTLYSGLFREALTGKYRLFKGLEVEPTTTVNTSGTGYAKADLVIGNLETTQIDLQDNQKIRIGVSQDLEIYHNATNSFIDNDTGSLYIRNNAIDESINIQCDANGSLANYITAEGLTGEVTLYWNGSTKLVTKSNGIAVTGIISNLTDPSAAQDAATKNYVDTQISANNELSEVLANGNTTGGTDIAVSANDDVTFTSSSKLIFTGGVGIINTALEMYHDGTDGYVQNRTGNLIIEQTTDDADIVFKNDDGSGGTIEYFRIDGSESRVVYGRSIHMADNVSVFLGNDDDGLIRYDSTANKILYTGTSQFSGDVDFVNNVTIPETPTADTHAASKGYVDAAVEGQDTLAEILANGNTSGGTSMIISNGDDLTVNTSTLKVDSTNSQVGINNASPSGFTSNSKDLIIGDGTGNRGITIYSSSMGYGHLFFQDVESSNSQNGGFISYGHNGDGFEIGVAGAGLGAGSLSIGSVSIFARKKLIVDATYSSTNTLTVDPSNARVGIFNDSPSYRLDVAGTGRFTGQIIATGDLIVDTDTLFVDASEDSVGINTSNPSSYSKHELVITAPDEGGVTIASATDEAAYLDFSDGSGIKNFIRVDHDGDIFGYNSWGSHLFTIGEGVDSLTLNSSGATFAGTIDSDNITVGKSDGNNSSISLTANTGNWTFTNVQASRNLEISDSDGTGVAMTIDTNANATFKGNVLIDTNANALLTLDGASGSTEGIIIKHSGTEVSRISHSNSTSLVFSTGSSVTTALTIDNSQNSTFAGDVNIQGNLTLSVASSFINTAAGDLYINPASNNTTLYDGTNAQIFNVYNAGALAIKLNAGTGGGVVLAQDGINFVHGYSGNGLVLSHHGIGPSNAIVSGNSVYPDNLYINNGGAASDWSNVIITGNVGIGTDSPDYNLEIEATDAKAFVHYVSASRGGIAAYSSQRIAFTTTGSSDDLVFGYNNGATATSANFVEHMRIDNGTGNVGIGATSPDFALDIEALDSGVQLQIGRTNTSAGSTWMGSDSNGFHLGVGAYGAGNSVADPNGFTVDTSGNVGIGTTSLSQKLSVSDSGGVTRVLIENTGNAAAGAGTQFLVKNGGTIVGQSTTRTDNAGNYSIFTGTSTEAERMRIDSSGNASIGDGGAGARGARLLLNNTGSQGTPQLMLIDSNDSGKQSEIRFDSGNLIFDYWGGTSRSGRMSILSTGEIVIGANESTTISTDPIHSLGNVNRPSVTGAMQARLVMQERSGNWISFVDGTPTHYGTISRSGSGVNYGSNSDYRLKENVLDLTNCIDKVKLLSPKTFNFIDRPNTTVNGFLAHEVQEIVPEAVTGEKDGYITTGNIINDSNGVVLEQNVDEPEELEEGTSYIAIKTEPKYQQIDQSKLVPLLVGAIQELKAEVELLKTQINN